MKRGSLFKGAGGLDLAVEQVLGGTEAWCSEIDPDASAVLAHHWPTVPNLGDITDVDWSTVEPVDVLTGGFPCQDVSSAGRRGGLRPGTRSGLWSHMAYAIAQLRPSLVIVENVRGLLSAEAHSDLEPCPWCVGDGEGEPPLRALGAVLGDLSVLGYDAVWCGLRAADVGAPHGRFRIFIAATDATSGGDAYESGRGHAPGQQVGSVAGTGGGDRSGDPASGVGELGRRPRFVASSTAANTDRLGRQRAGEARHGGAGSADHGAASTDAQGARREGTRSEPEGRGSERGGGTPAAIDSDGLARRPQHHGEPETGQHGQPGDDAHGRGVATDWGGYAPAVQRWERILGRHAPAPTVAGRRGGRQLNPVFVEWLMGLDEGHVTGVPGLSRNAKLRILGNGVVPAQAGAALRYLLPLLYGQEAAA